MTLRKVHRTDDLQSGSWLCRQLAQSKTGTSWSALVSMSGGGYLKIRLDDLEITETCLRDTRFWKRGNVTEYQKWYRRRNKRIGWVVLQRGWVVWSWYWVGWPCHKRLQPLRSSCSCSVSVWWSKSHSSLPPYLPSYLPPYRSHTGPSTLPLLLPPRVRFTSTTSIVSTCDVWCGDRSQ